MAALWLVLFATAAQATSLELGLYLNNRGTARAGQRNVTLLFDPSASGAPPIFFDPAQYLSPAPSSLYYSAFAEAYARLEAGDWFAARLAVNSGEVRHNTLSLDGTVTLTRLWTANGRPVADEARKTGFVREALLSVYVPETRWFQLDVGRKLWRVGNSLVYDDYGLGASLSFDFELQSGKPWRFDLTYLIPSRDWVDLPVRSPFVTAKLDYTLSLFETISLAFSYFHDGDGATSEIIRQTLIEADINVGRSVSGVSPALERRRQRALLCDLDKSFATSADLFYGILSGNKTLGPGMLRATVVVEGGRMYVQGAPLTASDCRANQPERELAFTQLGAAFDVAYRWSVSDRFAITPFVFGQTGRAFDGRGVYSAYVGVLPFLTRTNLFFAGGLSETFAARTVTAAGVNGRGVITPGIEALYEPVDPLRMRMVIAPLWSWTEGLAPPMGGGGRFYGFEADLVVLYQPWSFLGFAAEGDVLFGGGFYRSAEPVWKFILSTDLSGVFQL